MAADREPEQSLTLDDAARTRAAGALTAAIDRGCRGHYCDEYRDEIQHGRGGPGCRGTAGVPPLQRWRDRRAGLLLS